MSLNDRIRHLERSRPDIEAARARRNLDAAELVRAMMVQVDRFTDADAELSPKDLLRMSIKDHWAWAIRFQPDSANLATLAGLFVQHGQSVPGCLRQEWDCEGTA